jgi:hypothetical protein
MVREGSTAQNAVVSGISNTSQKSAGLHGPPDGSCEFQLANSSMRRNDQLGHLCTRSDHMVSTDELARIYKAMSFF